MSKKAGDDKRRDNRNDDRYRDEKDRQGLDNSHKHGLQGLLLGDGLAGKKGYERDDEGSTQHGGEIEEPVRRVEDGDGPVGLHGSEHEYGDATVHNDEEIGDAQGNDELYYTFDRGPVDDKSGS